MSSSAIALPVSFKYEAQRMKIGIERIALPPNNSMELTGQMRHVPCKEKSKGHAAFALQLMHGR